MMDSSKVMMTENLVVGDLLKDGRKAKQTPLISGEIQRVSDGSGRGVDEGGLSMGIKVLRW